MSSLELTVENTIDSQKTGILELIRKNPNGLSRGEIKKQLPFPINYKTLQRRLSDLIEKDEINRTGNRKSTRYYPFEATSISNKGHIVPKNEEIYSQNSLNKLEFLNRPVHSRKFVSYKREFIESYDPNVSFYIPKDIQASLSSKGKLLKNNLEAGTYRRILNYERLLIDLSFNSSRLEGNTYSLLDTEKLLKEGTSADGKMSEETVMVLNHKEAISFLVENDQEIDLNSRSIYYLHNLLSEDLIKNPDARGKIRQIEVSIGQTTYQPIANQFQLKELFELVLIKARKIKDPFEQSFFILIHLSYLQAFEDVNKRTSRLACNIPFIKNNFCAMSFTDVPRDGYIRALLAIYEKNEIEPMLDLFYWAYSRSCQKLRVLIETTNEIDPFRIKTRKHRRRVMGDIIRFDYHGKRLEEHIESYCGSRELQESDKFMAITLTELDFLHEGNIVGLGVSPEELNSWLEKEKKNR